MYCKSGDISHVVPPDMTIGKCRHLFRRLRLVDDAYGHLDKTKDHGDTSPLRYRYDPRSDEASENLTLVSFLGEMKGTTHTCYVQRNLMPAPHRSEVGERTVGQGDEAIVVHGP